MRPTMFTALPSHGQSIQTHIGEAFIHTIEGKITFVLYHSEEERTEYILKAGDSLNFQCTTPIAGKIKLIEKLHSSRFIHKFYCQSLQIDIKRLRKKVTS